MHPVKHISERLPIVNLPPTTGSTPAVQAGFATASYTLKSLGNVGLARKTQTQTHAGCPLVQHARRGIRTCSHRKHVLLIYARARACEGRPTVRLNGLLITIQLAFTYDWVCVLGLRFCQATMQIWEREHKAICKGD